MFSILIENQQLLLNSYASCRRLIDHMKQVVGIHQEGKNDHFSMCLIRILYYFVFKI
jgi:hypothetical protein